jgi:hypothetical protein
MARGDLEVKRHRFTAREYRAMGEAGVLGEDDRVELVDGEIVDMAPIGNRRLSCVVVAFLRFGEPCRFWHRRKALRIGRRGARVKAG